ncbi:MAG: reverse transcriptase family protein [Deltaproteobacteria bacterium]
MTEPNALPAWDVIAAEGGVDAWVHAELMRRDLIDNRDTSTLSDAEKKQYKARREEERRVRKTLKRHAWSAYRGAHLVHVGVGVFHHDTADVDKFDIEDPEARRRENDLPDLADVTALAKALDVTIPRLRWLAYHREVERGTHYHRWTVPKRTGGQRLISAPKPELKRVQHWIAQKITEHLPVHGAAHGFLPGRSTVTNARVHAGAKIVVKIDLSDFYPTITTPRVKGLLRKAGYGEQVATTLALLVTESPRETIEMKGKTYYVATGARSLPQGAPTSPSITNAICLRLDARISALVKSFGFRYTRYADDLTFSWHGKKDDAPIGPLLKVVGGIVRDEGFWVNRKKTRVLRRGRRQQITGLVVNDDHEIKARVPRRTVRNLRAAIKNLELGRGAKESVSQLRGMAAYVYMTDPKKGRAFLDRLAKLDD